MFGQFGNPIADSAGPVVELGRDGGEETTAAKDTALEVAGPGLYQALEPGKAGVMDGGSLDHPGLEDFAGGLEGGQLKVLLGSEMSEETALAHAQRVSEAADGEPRQAPDRRQIGRFTKDRSASCQAFGPLDGRHCAIK